MRAVSFAGLVIVMGCVATASPQRPADPAARALQSFALGVNQQRKGQSLEAIATLTDAINSHALKAKDAARAVFDRGVAYDSLGNSAAALADYTEALRLDPSLAAARNNRGNAYRRSGQLENAKRDYLAALSAPGAARQYPYYGLGLIAARVGDENSARAYFQKALAVDPGFRPAAQSLAALNPRPASKVGLVNVVASTPQSVAGVRLRQAITDTVVMVQLGAFRDEEAAKSGWTKAEAVAGGALDGLKSIIVMADLPGKGRFWRLRVALPGKSAARALCSHLIDRGQSCMPVKN